MIMSATPQFCSRITRILYYIILKLSLNKQSCIKILETPEEKSLYRPMRVESFPSKVSAVIPECEMYFKMLTA